ncbi:MAG TPA: hypothetical protein PLC59_06500 [Bacteroidales bacterium]|nr:hypothetical protein [Bacteroidales bacterium]
MCYLVGMNKNANIKNRIRDFAKRAKQHYESLAKGNVHFTEWNARNAELEQELIEIDKLAGKGLAVGRCLAFGVADGTATYIITKIKKNIVEVEWIPLGDAYRSPAVGLDSTKTKYIVLRSLAETYTKFSSLTSGLI